MSHTLAEYREFLKRKVQISGVFGFEVSETEIHPSLKPHQKIAVQWAVRGGRRALFEAFGLGKTRQQLEILRLILKRTGGRGLIVAPLGVRQEFEQEAQAIGISIQFIRSIEECRPEGLYITNYETVRDGKLDPSGFIVTSLDEAAILSSFGGTKTFREFMRLFEAVKYKFVATATPDPNEYIELLAYADYLGIMDTGQGKTRFFKRDATKADKLTLLPSKVQEWWLWVASWALFLQRPSDFGPEFSDEGYALPPLNVIHHEVKANHEIAVADRDGQFRMFRNSALGVTEAAREKRDSLAIRVLALLEILCDDQTGIQPGILSGTLRSDASEVDGLLPHDCEGSDRQSQKTRIHAGIPKDLATSCSNQRVQGQTESDSPGEVQIRSSLPGENEDAGQSMPLETAGAEARRTTSKNLRPHFSGEIRPSQTTGQYLSDLPPAGSEDYRELETSWCSNGGGPRSPQQDNQGHSLSQLQSGTRPIPRQPAAFGPRDCISQQFIVWCELDQEQAAVERGLKTLGISYCSLYGATPMEEREHEMLRWKNREVQAFISKPVMYGAGINMQQAHISIFVGVSFKFRQFIQAIHRTYRFLQNKHVEAHIIYCESEREVLKVLLEKWDRHKEQVTKMSEIIKEYGLSELALAQALTRSFGCERVEISGQGWQLVNNDSIEEAHREAARIADNSIGLILTSIPFATQYEYTPSYNDFGHSESNAQFFEQMDFLTPELYRLLEPGRIAAIHVKDRTVPGGMTGMGFQEAYPFHADCIFHFIKHGFRYLGMKTIVTDVVRENNQTYRLGWTEQCKDGTKMGYGMPEYLLLFRKPQTDRTKGYADIPVRKDKKRYSKARWQVDAHAFTRSNGNRFITPEEIADLPLAKDFHQKVFGIFHDYSLTNVYDFEQHVRIGETLERRGVLPVTFMLLQPPSWHPDVWTDITRMLTVNAIQASKGKAKHICPMQFDIADRVIVQMSNPGDTVLDPFSGLGTVPYRAVALGRKAIGIELNHQYFLDSAAYCKAAESKMEMPSLFDLIEPEATEPIEAPPVTATLPKRVRKNGHAAQV